MSDARLVSAFFCALFVHAALLGVTLKPPVSPPLLVSDASVTITLSRATPEPAIDSPLEPASKETQSKLPMVEAETRETPAPTVKETDDVLTTPEPRIPENEFGANTPQIEDPPPRRITRTDQKKIFPQPAGSRPAPAPAVAEPPGKPARPEKIRPPVSNPPPAHRKLTASASRVEPQAETVVEAVPLYRHNPKPVYPTLARKRMWEGTVLLLVTVERDGSVETCTVQQSSGYKILDRSALDAVRRWTFLPGSIDGRQIRMTVQIPVTFRLTSESHREETE